MSLRKQLVRTQPHIPRSEAIKRIFSAISQSGASFALVLGPRNESTPAFAGELASYVGSNAEADTLKETECGGVAFKFKLGTEGNGNKDKFFTIILIEDNFLAGKNEGDAIVDVSDAKRPCMLKPAISTRSCNPFNYRLKRRKIPLTRYAVQVILFFAISLLNNAA